MLPHRQNQQQLEAHEHQKGQGIAKAPQDHHRHLIHLQPPQGVGAPAAPDVAAPQAADGCQGRQCRPEGQGQMAGVQHPIQHRRIGAEYRHQRRLRRRQGQQQEKQLSHHAPGPQQDHRPIPSHGSASFSASGGASHSRRISSRASSRSTPISRMARTRAPASSESSSRRTRSTVWASAATRLLAPV